MIDVCSKEAEKNSEATCFKSRFATEGCQMLQEEREIRAVNFALKSVQCLTISGRDRGRRIFVSPQTLTCCCAANHKEENSKQKVFHM